MKITTDNIIELIEDYTNTEQVELNMITKKDGRDYQVWQRNYPYIQNDKSLIKGLSFDDGDVIMFYYTSKNDKNIGFNSIYVNELVGYNSIDKQEFIERYKLPRLQSQLESYVEKEEYDYAIQNRDFINHLKNQINKNDKQRHNT